MRTARQHNEAQGVGEVTITPRTNLGTEGVPTPRESPERPSAVVRHRSDDELAARVMELARARDYGRLLVLLFEAVGRERILAGA